MNTKANANTIDVSDLTARQLDLITQAFSRGCWNDDRIDFDLEHAFLARVYATMAAKRIESASTRLRGVTS